MKQFTFIYCLILLSMASNAQGADSWKIKWNGTLVLHTKTESESANTKIVSLARKENVPLLEIKYREADPKKDWKRSFLLFGENDNEILRIDSSRHATLSFDELEKVIGERRIVKIYTVSLPTDPNLAAAVRVRRIHLCTLVLK